ncbi:cytochrome P450 [Phaeosphaeria sp. MPI-PUGE-AT-0046c]|nr:cytochrome P450 [Phaeosphaeria sp. MPI-PUGE-AT-0046c]
MGHVLMLLVTVVLASGIFLFLRRRAHKRGGLSLPPGPKGFPFLGNVNDMPKGDVLECHHWLKHKYLYGSISSVTVLGQTFIIINDPDIAVELLRDRSSNYSSRPGQIFSGEMIGWRHATAMSPYTSTWKIHRKNVQEAESIHLLLNLLESPDKLFDHIRKEAGSVILKMTYGYTTELHGNDPFVDLAAETMVQFAEATVPGRWMVDILPFLKYLPPWVPGMGSKQTANKMAIQLKQCTNQPYEFVKQQMREGRHTPSFLSQCIEDVGTAAEMEFIYKWAALSLYLGGADTTVSSLMTFFLAMTLFPEVQGKAAEELNSIIGSDRLPISTDRDQLPYIEAVMKETHRWHLVLPMCLPHTSIAEDTCRGYRIPKGAILLPNNWHFTHDPETYPDPMVFKPERHLDTPDHDSEPDPHKYVFGYGRRICPGRHVADNALFITIAQCLTVFDIRKTTENGRVVEPKLEFEPGTITHPVPFRCSITAKSKAHEELVRAAEKDYPREKSDAEELINIKW